MITWIYYPRSKQPPPLALSVVQAFEAVGADIGSATHELNSNQVLAAVAPRLAAAGFRVETGKTTELKISVPVLFGLNGLPEKSFDADAYHEAAGFVVEVEAGRAVVNNQFLKDLFQASMMHDVTHVAIAVRKLYRGANRRARR